jgi:virginiamycin B lyase
VAGARWLGLLVLALLAAPSAHAQALFHLPRLTQPEEVALAADGTVWMTDDYGGVTRLSPDGRTKDLLTSDSDYVDGIVVGPDGALWADDDTKIVRIDTAGGITSFELPHYSFADGITATRDAVWFADGGNIGAGYRPRLQRIDASGARRAFIDPVPRSWLSFESLTAAPDGSLWFTQSRNKLGGGIGRMTPDGRFTNWWLASGQPESLVAGPDGAMWFTEGHALGRITTTGAISRFPLPSDLVATELAAGTDGALWFVSDICLGRMTTAGALTTWPVAGAKQLYGLAPAPDGTFWISDRIANVIRHFAPASAASAPCGAPSFARRAGATVASVSYQRDERFNGIDYFADIRIHIARHGRDLFHEIVPGLQRYAAHSDTTSLSVRDLDGDGEPEVSLLLNWNGTHCCYWSRIYRYDRARHRYVVANHFWGDAGTDPRLRDLDGDRRPEFLSRDDRFTEVFTGYAGSVWPIRIWSYRRGRFRDVTRRYPALIRRDAASLWRLYLKHRDDARGILPAWAADEDLLGRTGVADSGLETARARGDLKPADAVFGPRDPRAYIRAVKALLRKTGYTA